MAHIDTATGSCTNYNPDNDRYRVRFQPSGVSDNGPNSRMAWFGSDYTQSFQVTDGSFNGTSQAVKFVSIWTGSGSPSFRTKVKFATQEPGTITATTPFIQVTGEIQNYDFMQGCTVTFSMALTKTTE